MQAMTVLERCFLKYRRAYASRVLSKPERKYFVTRRELLAVIAFIKQFRHYLLGQQFTLRTDHGSLKTSKNRKDNWQDGSRNYKSTTSRSSIDPAGVTAMRMRCLACLASNVGGRLTCIPLAQGWKSTPLATLWENVHQKIFGSYKCKTRFVFQAKEKDSKSPDDNTREESIETSRLMQLWDQLEIKDRVIWRRFESKEGTTSHLQLIVPREIRKEVLHE